MVQGIKQLFCLIRGEIRPFSVKIAEDSSIADLKDEIYRKCNLDTPKGTSARDLVLLKVNINLGDHTADSLVTFASGEVEGETPREWDTVSGLWEHPPPKNTLHLLVTLPTAASHVPSGGVGTDPLRLTVLPIDGDKCGAPLYIEPHPLTGVDAIHNIIRNALIPIHIGRGCTSYLEILPLEMTPTLDKVKKQDLAALRRAVKRPDEPPEDSRSVSELFSQGNFGGVHFLVWLPAVGFRYPPSIEMGELGWLRKFILRQAFTLTVPTDASSAKTAQRTFKELLKENYRQGNDGRLFDMASGNDLEHGSVIAAHIYQKRWGPLLRQACSLILSDINFVGNGLLLFNPVEKAFDLGRICIEVDSSGWMTFYLLDKTLQGVKLVDEALRLRQKSGRGNCLIKGEQDLRLTFGDLHGREVHLPPQFLTPPSKRLLGLHAAVAWMHRPDDSPVIPIPRYNASGDRIAELCIKRLLQ